MKGVQVSMAALAQNPAANASPVSVEAHKGPGPIGIWLRSPQASKEAPPPPSREAPT